MYKRQVKWYRKAAAQGDAEGQNNLGSLYENGRGVPQDNMEAMRLYRAAAKRGSLAARGNLERLESLYE